jgi:hypothetical protein
MIEVESIPEKRDKVLIVVQLILYSILIFFYITSGSNVKSLTIGLATMTFYNFRFKDDPVFTAGKSYLIGITAFNVLQYYYSLGAFRGVPYTRELETDKLVLGSMIIFFSCIVISYTKKHRAEALQPINQKTAND